MTYTHDYTSCMMTKLLMAEPDRKGGSDIYYNCMQALDIFRQTDNLTHGIKKIVYLVGWQYLGHDDKYPSFHGVNSGIKNPSDKTALDSLLWLIDEAKQYNTIVSLHINFTDCYEDSPLYDDYVKANALIRDASGKNKAIEKYNGKKCYKISYKEEWNSGLFHKRVDKLLAMLPIEAAGTVHVDNFQCYVNRAPYVSAEEMQYYRSKMIAYLREKGVDITSEFTYREGKGSVVMYGKVTRDFTPTRYPIALLNQVPASWWVDKMTIEEYYKYYPHIYGGGMPKCKLAASLFYGNIHAEDLWAKPNWHSTFIHDFSLINVPFYFLNKHARVTFTDSKHKAVAYEGDIVSNSNGVITMQGKVVKDNESVFLPYLDGYIVYSTVGKILATPYNIDKVRVTELTISGNIVRQSNIAIKDMKIEANKLYFVKSV